MDREDWIHSMKCQKAFKLVNKEVGSRNHSRISPDLAVSVIFFIGRNFACVSSKIQTKFQHQKGWIGDDGVHLHKNHAMKYWEDNFKDIQFQIDRAPNNRKSVAPSRNPPSAGQSATGAPIGPAKPGDAPKEKKFNAAGYDKDLVKARVTK